VGLEGLRRNMQNSIINIKTKKDIIKDIKSITSITTVDSLMTPHKYQQTSYLKEINHDSVCIDH